MAIGAHRRLAITVRDGLSVDAGIEGVLNVGMTLSAGGRHIGLGDGRLGIIGGEDRMPAVAIRADGSFQGSVLYGAAMHTVLIGEEGLVTDAV